MSEEFGPKFDPEEDDVGAQSLSVDVSADTIEAPSESILLPTSLPPTEIVQTQSGIRERAQRIVNSDYYKLIQHLATFAALVGPPSVELYYGQKGQEPVEANINAIRYACDAVFAINLISKFTANGLGHLKDPECWIDSLALAADAFILMAGGQEVFSGFRAMRGAKGTRVMSGMARAANVAGRGNPLEDAALKGSSQISTGLILWLLITVNLTMRGAMDFDSSKPEGYLSEMGLYASILVGAAISRMLFKGLIKKTYSDKFEQATEVVESAGEKAELATLMELVKKYIKQKENEGELNEVTRIVEAFAEALRHTGRVINPTGRKFKTNERGRIIPEKVDMITLVTDIRNYTSLTEQIEKEGRNIFEFGQKTYFPFLESLMLFYGGRRLNYTGDGVIFSFEDIVDKNGNVIKSKEVAAIEGAMVLQEVTEYMSLVFASKGYGNLDDESSLHRTGIGLTCGEVTMGDVFTMIKEGHVSEDDVFGQMGIEIAEFVSAKIDQISKEDPDLNDEPLISSIVASGSPLNEGERIQSLNKTYPGYICLIDQKLLDRLSPGYQDLFIEVALAELKGVKKPVQIFGIPRETFEDKEEL